jgi:hypothetical protein
VLCAVLFNQCQRFRWLVNRLASELVIELQITVLDQMTQRAFGEEQIAIWERSDRMAKVE